VAVLELAHSGAEIIVANDYVIKHGKGTAAQAAYMKQLPSSRTPAIEAVWEGGYIMELLKEPSLKTPDELRELLLTAKQVLSKEFWSRSSPTMRDENWKEQLEDWAPTMGFPWLTGYVNKLYPNVEMDRMIHGDPTLANCMEGDAGQLVFIDPLRPMGKIPNFPEVDMGKLLQSALGWEHALLDTIPRPWPGMASELLAGTSNMIYNRAWFWCAVHCARLVPYATRDPIRKWGRKKSEEAIRAVRL
jgi:hypothetical protein